MSGEPPRHEHPAPHRTRVPVFWLLAGLAIPPGAWIAEMLVGVAVASNACPLGSTPIAARHGFGGEAALLTMVIALCLVATIASGLMSRRHWQAVRDEKEGGAHSHLTRGEGRTRFLAMAGMLSAATFAIAILFNLLEPAVIPLCWNAR